MVVPAGGYRVLAYDPGGVYATAFDANADSFESSPLTPVGEEAIRRDFRLVRGGTAAGTVVRSDGTTGQGFVVEAYNLSGTRRAFTATEAQGRYSLVLPPGEYKLIAYDPGGDYAFAFHPGVRTFGQASPVPVRAGVAVTADFRLDLAARVSGTVVDLSTGLPIAGITVYAYTPAGAQVTATVTAANGMFQLSLPPGDYRFAAADPARRYAVGFYGLGRAFETSVTVSIKAGSVLANVQLGLMRAATISGQVRDAATGAPIVNVVAAAYNLDGTLHASALTGAAGAYELLVAPGAYKLLVFDPHLVYATGFPGGARHFASSGSLGVAAGQALRQFDFTLRRGARVTGTVREGAQPRGGITVGAYDAAGVLMASTNSGDDGAHAQVVPPGEYRLVAFDPTLRYAPAYDGDAASFDQTIPRLLPAGGAAVVDLAVRRGIRVQGSVLGPSGEPVSGVEAFAVDAAGNRVAGAATRADGTFSLAALPAAYKFVAVDPYRRYAVSYYDQATSLGAARWVTVADGAPVQPIVFRLEPSSKRRGVRH